METAQAPPEGDVIAGKPAVELPCDGRPLGEFARDMGRFLNHAGVYARGGLAFRIDRENDTLDLVKPGVLRTWAEKELTLYKQGHTTQSQTIRIKRSMTLDTAKALVMAPQFLEELPEIRGFAPVTMPIIRESGAIELLPSGYDLESMTLTREDGCKYRADMSLEKGRAVIEGALAEFPFVNARSKSVAVAAMLTVYARGLLPEGAAIPAFIYLGNAEGSGKTTLATLAGIPFGVIEVKTVPTTETEWQKRLLTLVMSGRRLVLLDNARGHLDSPSLEAYLSASRYGDRILGVSQDFTGNADAVILITGNRSTITPDLRRRSLFVELFMSELRGEDRKFEKRLDDPAILKIQPDLLAAMYSLVRNWDKVDRPSASRESASFPRWSDVIGGIVEAAGFGCPTEPAHIDDGGDSDTQDIAQLAEIMEPGRNYTFAELTAICQEAGLFERFTDDRERGELTRKSKSGFGRALKGFDRRHVAMGRQFLVLGKGHGRRYQLRSAD